MNRISKKWIHEMEKSLKLLCKFLEYSQETLFKNRKKYIINIT